MLISRDKIIVGIFLGFLLLTLSALNRKPTIVFLDSHKIVKEFVKLHAKKTMTTLEI